MGFFVKGRLAPILASVINIGLSILFCRLWGVAGIFLATTVARISSLAIIDSYIIFKYGFNRSPWVYFVKNAGFLALFIVLGLLCSWLLTYLDWHSWYGVIIQIIAVLIVYNGVMILIFYRTQNFKEIVAAGKTLLKRKK